MTFVTSSGVPITTTIPDKESRVACKILDNRRPFGEAVHPQVIQTMHKILGRKLSTESHIQIIGYNTLKLMLIKRNFEFVCTAVVRNCIFHKLRFDRMKFLNMGNNRIFQNFEEKMHVLPT
jgi:hypothetical protein